MLRQTNFLLCVALPVAVLVLGCDESLPRADNACDMTGATGSAVYDDYASVGSYAVGETVWDLVDDSRTTMANGMAAELPERSLNTIVWYPADTAGVDVQVASGSFPLIVWSHGFSSNNGEVGWLARHLVSRGYIVASPRYPLTNISAPGGPNVRDVVNQPGDWSFVLDAVLAANADSGSLLNGAVDSSRIVAGGLSLGAMTTMLVTHHGLYRDARVTHAITMAGPGDIFGPDFFTAEVPHLIIHGDADEIVDYDANAVPLFRRAPRHVGLLRVAGGTHTSFAGIGAILGDAVHADEGGCGQLTGALPTDGAPLDLGGDMYGLLEPSAPPPCEGPFGDAIAGRRQHEITRVAVAAYLDAYVGDPAGRAESCQYYEQRMDSDVAEFDLMLR